MNGGRGWIARAQAGSRDVRRNRDTLAAVIFLDPSDLGRRKGDPCAVAWGDAGGRLETCKELSLGRVNWSPGG